MFSTANKHYSCLSTFKIVLLFSNTPFKRSSAFLAQVQVFTQKPK